MTTHTMPPEVYNLDNDATDTLNKAFQQVRQGDTVVFEGPVVVNGTLRPTADPDDPYGGATRTLADVLWVLPSKGSVFQRTENPPVVGRQDGDPVRPEDVVPVFATVGLVHHRFSGGFHFANLAPPAKNTGYTTREWDHTLLIQGQDADHPKGQQLCGRLKFESFVSLGSYGDGISVEVGPNDWASPFGIDIGVKRISQAGRQAITVAVGGWRDPDSGAVRGIDIHGITPTAPMQLDAMRSIFDLEATGKVIGLTIEDFVVSHYGDSLLASQGNQYGIEDFILRRGHVGQALKILVHPGETDEARNKRWQITELSTDWPVAANDTTPISIHRTDGLLLDSLHQPARQRAIELGAVADGTLCSDVVVSNCTPKVAWAPYQPAA